MGLPLPSALKNKSFSNPEAIQMSLSAAPRVVRQGSQSVTEAATTGPDAKCFPQHAPSAARTLKYPLNLAVISRFIVAIATVKSDRVGNAEV